MNDFERTDLDGAGGTADDEGIRLQKVLAAAGLGSRRACEELIDAGRVEVDGQTVREQGMRVDPDVAIIKVDGARLPTRSGMVYLVLNKPRGVVSTMNDPENRPCVGDYVRDRTERLFHVGRLDTDTEGLILFTNDGDLAQRLTHPKYGVPKIYFADIPGPIARDLSRTLKKGVELEDGIARADKFRMIGQSGSRVQVEVEIHEGRNHIVRRMLEAVGHPVSRLVRVQIGAVNMGNLGPGRLRHLTRHEISALLTASEVEHAARDPKPAKKPGARKTGGAKAAGSRAAGSRAAGAKAAGAKKVPGKKAADRKAADRRAPGEKPSGRKATGATSYEDKRVAPAKRGAPAERGGAAKRPVPAKRAAPAKRSAPAKRAAPAPRGASAQRGASGGRSAPSPGRSRRNEG